MACFTCSLLSLTNSLSCTDTRRQSLYVRIQICIHTNCTRYCLHQNKRYNRPVYLAASCHTRHRFCCLLCRLPSVPQPSNARQLARRHSFSRYQAEIGGIGHPRTTPTKLTKVPRHTDTGIHRSPHHKIELSYCKCPPHLTRVKQTHISRNRRK